MRPWRPDAPGLTAAGAPPRNEAEAHRPHAPLMRSRLGEAAAHLMAATPTRALLAWSMASPLTPYAEVERELAQCGADFICDEEPPAGSLGQACIIFRRSNRLRPMKTAVAPTDAAQKLAVRRLSLHDALHVLLDFASDWPGQLGVFSFVAAQRYCPQFEWAARTLGQAYVTAAPWLRADLGAAEARGRKLAHAAPRLLTMPLEQVWSASLIPLQVRWNLKPAMSLGAIDWGARVVPLRPAPWRARLTDATRAGAAPARRSPP